MQLSKNDVQSDEDETDDEFDDEFDLQSDVSDEDALGSENEDYDDSLLSLENSFQEEQLNISYDDDDEEFNEDDANDRG